MKILKQPASFANYQKLSVSYYDRDHWAGSFITSLGRSVRQVRQVRPSVSPIFSPFVSPFVRLFVCLSVRPSARPSACPPSRQPASQPVSQPVSQSASHQELYSTTILRTVFHGKILWEVDKV